MEIRIIVPIAIRGTLERYGIERMRQGIERFLRTSQRGA